MGPRAWAKRISLCACCLLAVAARLTATTIELKNGNGAVGTVDPLGVDYSATVSFIPEPAPTMLAGIGVMAVVAFWPVVRMHRATARRGK